MRRAHVFRSQSGTGLVFLASERGDDLELARSSQVGAVPLSQEDRWTCSEAEWRKKFLLLSADAESVARKTYHYMTSSWLPRATACRDSTLHSSSGVEWPRPSKAGTWAEHRVQQVIADIVQPSDMGLLRIKH